VALLEGGNTLIQCDQDPATCERKDSCLTRYLWMEAAKAMYTRLSEITFADLMSLQEVACKEKFLEYLTPQKQSSPSLSLTK
jgi:DNA-binding IscR family transcriptional regulator